MAVSSSGLLCLQVPEGCSAIHQEEPAQGPEPEGGAPAAHWSAGGYQSAVEKYLQRYWPQLQGHHR